MAGRGVPIPSFSALGDVPPPPPPQSTDDPFSSYNAKKQVIPNEPSPPPSGPPPPDDDPFANYNAKIASGSSDMPNITISVPISKNSDSTAHKIRRVSEGRGESHDRRDRDLDLRIQIRNRVGEREEREHQAQTRSEDRDRRYPEREHDRYRDDRGRRYEEERRHHHSSERGHRAEQSRRGAHERPETPAKSFESYRQVPAFRAQAEKPVSRPREIDYSRPSDNPDLRRDEYRDPNYDRRPLPHQEYPPPQRYPARSHPRPAPYPHHPAPEHHHPEHHRPDHHHPDQRHPQARHQEERQKPAYLDPPHAAEYRDIPLQRYPPSSVYPPRQHPYRAEREREEYRDSRDRGEPVHPGRDRFGPIYRGHGSTPPPVQAPKISDIAAIMASIKEKSSKDLAATKDMISNLLPKPAPEPSTSEENPTEAIPGEEVTPARLGNSNYSSAAVSYEASASSTPPPPQANSPPKNPGKNYANLFSAAADKYKSNWVKTPEKDTNGGSAEGSAANNDAPGNILKLSGNLEVDLNQTNEAQVNLLASYFKRRTRGLRAVADFVPVRDRNRNPSGGGGYDDDNETAKSIRNAFNAKPEPVPGAISCDQCRKWNLPPDEYRRHVNTDFHCWMDGSWRHKLPGFLPRFSLIWCTICRDYFMLTFGGNTLIGHEDEDDHRKNKSIYRLHYDDVPQTKYCILSELRTTKVKMPTPLKCKYFQPKEALNSYKATYSKLCERNLVVD